MALKLLFWAGSSASAEPVPDYLATLNQGVNGLRIAVPREMLEFEGLDSETRDAVLKTVAVLEELGAVSHEVSMPSMQVMAILDWLKAGPAGYLIHSAGLRRDRVVRPARPGTGRWSPQPR